MTARNRGTSLIGKLSCYITYIIVIHRDIVTTTWTHATFCPKAGAELEYWLPQLDNDPAIYRMAWRLTMVKNQTNKKKITILHTALKNYFVLIHFHFFCFFKWSENEKIKTCSKIFIRWSTMHGGVSYLLDKSSNGCDGGTCPL